MAEQGMNLGMPSGQGNQQQGQQQPDWFTNFTMQSGPQQGQAGYYADQYTDIANQYSGQLGQLGQQYGQEALYDPAFMRMEGFDGFQNYNPFGVQDVTGNVGGQYDWSFNAFAGLSGVQEGMDYLGHYQQHGQAAKKNLSAGDQQFFNNYKAYGQENYDNNTLLYGSGQDHWRDEALKRSAVDYRQLQGLQSQYGGY